MIRRILGVLFCAVWALAVGYMLVDLATRSTFVATPLPDDQFAAGVVGLALLVFIGLLLVFRSDAAKPMVSEGSLRDAQSPHELGVTCPTCHAAMELRGEYPDLGVNHGGGIYIWRCANEHWWRRVGANAADSTFPWRVLTAAAASDSLSPKVFFG